MRLNFNIILQEEIKKHVQQTNSGQLNDLKKNY